MKKKEKIPLIRDADTTRLNQDLFLAEWLKSGSLKLASKNLKVPWMRHFVWMKKDPEYAARFKAMGEELNFRIQEEIEEAFIKRATVGEDEPVVQKGEIVFGWWDEETKQWVGPGELQQAPERFPNAFRRAVTYRKYDTVAGIVQLKRLSPDQYIERRAVDVTTGGEPVKQFINVDMSKL